MSQLYQAVNYNDPIPDLSKAFHITCGPSTDVWEKPPDVHSFNAPIIYRKTTVAAFQTARVTVSAAWQHKYDQGGLCLVIHARSGPRRWVKTGIEYLDGKAHVSTVATDQWSDWSLRPVLEPGSMSTTIEMESNTDGSLWVYVVSPGGEKHPLREVTWWGDLKGDQECWIGVYVAKPAPGGETEDLEVHFEGLDIQI